MAGSRRKRPSEPVEVVEPTPPVLRDAGEHFEEMFGTYAKYVIEDRAVPNVCDGLKPVARRLMWAALNLNPTPAIPGNPTVKCARISGDCMSKYHPHGDAYLALVRMAQPFSLRLPLIDFQGNYGSPDFGPAASRYTEARLGSASMALLAQVRDGTVEMIPNYDGLNVEPEVLPGGFPNILVNGSFGIAVGISSNIPPHNPLDVVAAARLLIDEPTSSVEDLAAVLKGPDYPSATQVVNADDLVDVYRSGVGQIRLRGTWIVEEPVTTGRKSSGQLLVITSLPYVQGHAVSTEGFIAAVVKEVNDGRLSGIVDIINSSADGEMRVVIELAAGIDSSRVIPALLRSTELQVTNAVRFHALDADGNPQLYNLRTMLEAWVQHRIACIDKRSRRRIEAINERLHLLSGLLLALLDIDAAIAIIRAADDVAEARIGLMARFGLDELQANYVLDLTLRRLTRLARVELEREQTALQTELARLERLISSAARLRRQVGVELEECAMTLFKPDDPLMARRTMLTTAALPQPVAAVLDQPLEVVVTADGYIQALRSGPRAKAKTDGPMVLHRLAGSTAGQFVALTDRGQLHRLLGVSIPEGKATALPNVLTGLASGERVVLWGTTPPANEPATSGSIPAVASTPFAISSAASGTFPTELLFVTSSGTIKRIGGEDLANGDRKGGISVIKLDGGERLIAALPWVETAPIPDLTGQQTMLDAEPSEAAAGGPYMLVTRLGQTIRFAPTDVRPMGRQAAGVRGIKLGAGDDVAGAVLAADADTLLIVQGKGGAKRVPCSEFPVQGRAGKGVRGTVTGPRFGDIVAVASVTPGRAGTLRNVRLHDGTWVEVDLSAAPASSREGGPGKIRNFDGRIVEIV